MERPGDSPSAPIHQDGPPLILDVSGADGTQRGLLRSVVSTVERGCDATGAKLVVVAEPAQRRSLDIRDRTPSTSSVGEALQRIAVPIRSCVDGMYRHTGLWAC